MVQACVRGWLARRYYMRLKVQMAISVLTLQKHVRGWLTRKRLERQKHLAKKEQMEQEHSRRHQKGGVSNKNKAIAKAKALKRMTSDDSDNDTSSSNKENVSSNKAAVVIQSHFRGYTARRRLAKGRAPPPPQGHAPPAPHQRQRADELHTFADQEVHVNLRRNKPGVPLESIQKPPQDYRPPPGFTLVPAIIRGQMSQQPNIEDASRLSRHEQNSNKYEDKSQNKRRNIPCSRQCSGLVRNKIIELVKQTQKSNPPPKPVYSPAYDPESDLRKILRNSPEILATPLYCSDDDYNDGPFRFKQLLRPTVGPTESLRKRKVRNSGQCPLMSDSSQDSNSSKELKLKK